MDKSLSVLLIEDDFASSYLHKKVIKESDNSVYIISVANGYEALNYITNIFEEEYVKPDLIFLDLNMPLMDGWEYIQSFNELPSNITDGIYIAVLSNSVHSADRRMVEESAVLNRFIPKPLTKEIFQEIVKEIA